MKIKGLLSCSNKWMGSQVWKSRVKALVGTGHSFKQYGKITSLQMVAKNFPE